VDRKERKILEKLSQQADQFEIPVEDFVWEAIQKEVLPFDTVINFERLEVSESG
jgi:hypothetical protein